MGLFDLFLPLPLYQISWWTGIDGKGYLGFFSNCIHKIETFPKKDRLMKNPSPFSSTKKIFGGSPTPNRNPWGGPGRYTPATQKFCTPPEIFGGDSMDRISKKCRVEKLE
jgi:hypothetical protein